MTQHGGLDRPKVVQLAGTKKAMLGTEAVKGSINLILPRRELMGVAQKDVLEKIRQACRRVIKCLLQGFFGNEVISLIECAADFLQIVIIQRLTSLEPRQCRYLVSQIANSGLHLFPICLGKS